MEGTFVQAFACMYVVQQGIRGLCFYRATSTNKTSHIIMLLSNVISDLQSVCQNIVHLFIAGENILATNYSIPWTSVCFPMPACHSNHLIQIRL